MKNRVKYWQLLKRRYYVSKKTTRGWYLVESFKWKISAVWYIRRVMDKGNYLLRNNYNGRETYYYQK